MPRSARLPMLWAVDVTGEFGSHRPKADRLPSPWPEGGGGDDLVGGFGQLGEAVGQAGAGQDEVVGFEDFGLAEFGQQVQVVAEGLQLLVGFFRQEIAGLAWRSVPIPIKWT